MVRTIAVFGFSRRSVCALVLMMASLCMIITQARSQSLPPDFNPRQAVMALMRQPSAQVLMQTSVNTEEHPLLKAECATLKPLETTGLFINDTPVFEVKGERIDLKSGSWIMYIKVDRCGQTVLRRLLITYVPEKQAMQARGLMPGEFQGNVALELDAQRMILPAIMATAECKDLQQVAVIYVKADGGAKAEGWTETWTVQACGKKVSARVAYRQSAKGGIDIISKDYKLLKN